MAADLGCTVQDLMARPDLRAQIQLERYVTDTVGLPTLQDILERTRQARPRPARSSSRPSPSPRA